MESIEILANVVEIKRYVIFKNKADSNVTFERINLRLLIIKRFGFNSTVKL
jgi:hypothetical protein